MAGNKNSGFATHPENINKSGGTAPAWTFQSLYINKLNSLNPQGIPYKLAIVDNMVERSARGDKEATKEITDRVDGRPNQNLNVEGNVTISFHDSLKQDEQ